MNKHEGLIESLNIASASIFKDAPDNLFLRAVELIISLEKKNEQLKEEAFKLRPRTRMVDDNYKYIAVDFDGTLCGHKFPEIGEPIQEMISFVRTKSAEGTKIILHTCRENGDNGRAYLDEAVSWCEEHDIPIDAVNCNPFVPFGLRKIYADIYIDDRAVNVNEIVSCRPL